MLRSFDPVLKAAFSFSSSSRPKAIRGLIGKDGQDLAPLEVDEW
jgi:hypothetical protein